MKARTTLPLVMIVALLAAPRVVRASEPMDATASNAPADKAGPFMLNVRGGLGYGEDLIGPSTGYTQFESQWAAALDIGYAMFGDGNGYFVIAPQMQKGPISTVRTLTAGVQYDLPLTRFTRENLYLYTRMEIGYSRIEQAVASTNSFTMIYDLGIKYVVARRINVGLEPLSWALYQIGDRFGESKFRFFGSLGVNL